MYVPLNANFRYHTEPWSEPSSAGLEVLLRPEEVQTLARRLEHSTGGAHLVTGYRGVGKTTFVNAAVRSMHTALDSKKCPTQLYDVHLAIARPMTAVELMHHVLRGVHEKLRRDGVLSRLPSNLREELTLAFLRTSAALTMSSSEGVQTESNNDLALPFVGNLRIGGKFSRGTEKALEYLAYDDKAAESDLIRIAKSLRSGVRLRRWSKIPLITKSCEIRLLVVLDELDKLDTLDSSALDSILNNLKTLLTASGITFVFVAGRDLYDRWLVDVGRGDSVIESIFADATYVPVAWDQVSQLCDPLVADGALKEDERVALEHFKGYLAYIGRGIPRRVLRGFNEQVSWKKPQPELDLSERRRFTFYARLREEIFAAEQILFGDTAAEAQAELLDRQRLAVLYICDWILSQGFLPFDFKKVHDASQALSARIAPETHIAAKVSGNLLSFLVAREYLETLDTLESHTNSSDDSATYRVVHRRLIEMGRYVELIESEVGGVPDFGPKYSVHGLLGAGGTCDVYAGVDSNTGRAVALKVSRNRTRLVRDSIRNEVKVLQKLVGPNIVELIDSNLEAKQPYLVLEQLDGLLMSELVHESNEARVDSIVSIGMGLITAIRQIHRAGYIWRDVKPSNIFITYQGRVVLFDFGLAVPIDGPDPFVTSRRGAGTLPYTAPELLRGESASIVSDVFALCVLFYQQLSDRLPFSGTTPQELLEQMAAGADQLSNVPDALRRLAFEVEKGLAVNPFERTNLDRLADSLADVKRAELFDVAHFAESASKVKGRTVYLTKRFDLEIAEKEGEAEVEQSSPWIGARTRRLEEKSTIVVAPLREQDKPRLKIETSDGSISYFSLGSLTECKIGRSEDNDLVIVDPSLSRFHAVLVKDENSFRLTELNSRNGIEFNGTPLRESSVLLVSGDVFEMGKTTLSLQL